MKTTLHLENEQHDINYSPSVGEDILHFWKGEYTVTERKFIPDKSGQTTLHIETVKNNNTNGKANL